MANAIQQQISQQREQISQQRQQISQAERQASQIPQEQLRGVERKSTLGRVTSALMARLTRGRKKEKVTKTAEQLSQQERAFEQQVASQAPKYGRPELVQQEYQRAKERLDTEIRGVESRIDSYQKGYQKALKEGKEKRADRYWINIQSAQEEKNVLSSYLTDPIKTIRGVSSGRAFREASARASFKESKMESSKQRGEQLRALGFSSKTEYIKAKPTFTNTRKNNICGNSFPTSSFNYKSSYDPHINSLW